MTEFKTLSQHLRQRKSSGVVDVEDEESQEEDEGPRGGTGSRKER